LALAYGYGLVSQVTGDPTGYVYLVPVTLPWSVVPIPGEWYWALIVVGAA
jgi:hypothetical protein